jgi:hypothetical protein
VIDNLNGFVKISDSSCFTLEEFEKCLEHTIQLDDHLGFYEVIHVLKEGRLEKTIFKRKFHGDVGRKLITLYHQYCEKGYIVKSFYDEQNMDDNYIKYHYNGKSQIRCIEVYCCGDLEQIDKFEFDIKGRLRQVDIQKNDGNKLTKEYRYDEFNLVGLDVRGSEDYSVNISYGSGLPFMKISEMETGTLIEKYSYDGEYKLKSIERVGGVKSEFEYCFDCYLQLNIEGGKQRELLCWNNSADLKWVKYYNEKNQVLRVEYKDGMRETIYYYDRVTNKLAYCIEVEFDEDSKVKRKRYYKGEVFSCNLIGYSTLSYGRDKFDENIFDEKRKLKYIITYEDNDFGREEFWKNQLGELLKEEQGVEFWCLKLAELSN